MTENNNAELIQGLEELTQFLREKPTLPKLDGSQMSVHRYQDRKHLPAVARLLGTTEKKAEGEYFAVVKKFSAGLELHFFSRRHEVCEKVKIGEKVIPAQPERIIPEQKLSAVAEHIEDVFAWKCPDSLLNLDPPEDDDEEDDIDTPIVSEPATVA